MRYIILTLLTLSFAFAGDAKPLPYEAQQAVNAMDAAINKARQECLVKLNKVIMDITKTGNLEAAMVVKAKETEIMDAMPHVDLFGDQHGLVGKWQQNKNVVVINGDGTALCQNDGNTGKWVVNNNKFIINWNTNGITTTWNLPVKNNTLYGKLNNGYELTMTKIK